MRTARHDALAKPPQRRPKRLVGCHWVARLPRRRDRHEEPPVPSRRVGPPRQLGRHRREENRERRLLGRVGEEPVPRLRQLPGEATCDFL